jgi:hypothetical protein
VAGTFKMNTILKILLFLFVPSVASFGQEKSLTGKQKAYLEILARFAYMEKKYNLNKVD